MSCEHLICAACSGPVAEGRCPTCRNARSEVHVAGPFGFSPEIIAMLAALAALLIIIATHARA